MKRVLVFVVLAVAACTTFAQHRVQKFFNNVNYNLQKLENTERQVEGMAMTANYYRARRVAAQEPNVETRYVNGLGTVSHVYMDNLVLVVTPTDVEVLIPENGELKHLVYVTRNDYGVHPVATGVLFNGYKNLRAVVENNNVKTVIRLYDGPERVVKSFWFDQIKQQISPKYPRSKRRHL